jgi:hypothetical protein
MQCEEVYDKSGVRIGRTIRPILKDGSVHSILIDPILENMPFTRREMKDDLGPKKEITRYSVIEGQLLPTAHEIDGELYLQGDQTMVKFTNGIFLTTRTVREMCYYNCKPRHYFQPYFLVSAFYFTKEENGCIPSTKVYDLLELYRSNSNDTKKKVSNQQRLLIASLQHKGYEKKKDRNLGPHFTGLKFRPIEIIEAEINNEIIL